MCAQAVQRRESYVCLNYGKKEEPISGRVDFSQLKRADYRKDPLVLGDAAQPLTVTNRQVFHLIRATEKQSNRVFRGGWLNVFLGLPALFGWLARWLEVRNTTKELLHAAVGDICHKATLDKLLSSDPMLARFLVRALIDKDASLSKEAAVALVEGWSCGQLTAANFDGHSFEAAVLKELLPKDARKDSPGLRAIRQAISALETPKPEPQSVAVAQPAPVSEPVLEPLPVPSQQPPAVVDEAPAGSGGDVAANANEPPLVVSLAEGAAEEVCADGESDAGGDGSGGGGGKRRWFRVFGGITCRRGSGC